MSPEPETLDQLLGGDLPLGVIRGLYPNADAFSKGVLGLLTCGDVKLIFAGVDVPRWQWAQFLANPTPTDGPIMSLTDQGAAGIG